MRQGRGWQIERSVSDMLRLLILRHAKSDWDNAKLDDFDRPLSKRGRKDAPRMGRYIAEHASPLDHVLCSSAVRTCETWALMATALSKPPEPQMLRAMYLAGPDALLEIVRAAPPTCSTLLIIGHNPGLHELALSLCSSRSSTQPRKVLAKKFPTAALAVLQFRVKSWGAVKPGTGLLTAFVTPKLLTADL